MCAAGSLPGQPRYFRKNRIWSATSFALPDHRPGDGAMEFIEARDRDLPRPALRTGADLHTDEHDVRQPGLGVVMIFLAKPAFLGYELWSHMIHQPMPWS